MNETYETEPYDDRDGTVLGRVHISRRFAGELEGTSTAELLTAGTDQGSAAYVALDRITGRLHGQEGSFVLQHHGVVSPAGAVTSGAVVPHSATGELRGLRGEGEIAVAEDGGHTLRVESTSTGNPGRRRPLHGNDFDETLESCEVSGVPRVHG